MSVMLPIAPIMPEPVPPGKLKLLERVRWHLRLKRYSIRTEAAYIDWIRHVKASLTCRG